MSSCSLLLVSLTMSRSSMKTQSGGTVTISSSSSLSRMSPKKKKCKLSSPTVVVDNDTTIVEPLELEEVGTNLRILTWNCSGKFREKCHILTNHYPNADILIIQECEDPDLCTSTSTNNKNKNQYRMYKEWIASTVDSYIWISGDGKGVRHRGMGIFVSKSSSSSLGKIKLMDNTIDDGGMKLFLPVEFETSGVQVLGVWTKATKKYSTSYVYQLWKYLDLNLHKFNHNNLIIVGDFNSNAIWNPKRKVGNHQHVLDLLTQYNLVSAYHALNEEENHGEERNPTFYLHRNVDKPYHLDYVVVPRTYIITTKDIGVALTNQVPKASSEIVVGSFDDWISYSDHMPLLFSTCSSDVS